MVILALVPPLGAFLHRVLEGERHVLQRPLGWLERLLLRLGGADGREQSWQTYSLGMLAFSAFTMLVTYAIQRTAAPVALQPAGPRPGGGPLGLQHGRQLHDQHELAGLRRRVDDELSQPDGGPRLAQLHSAAAGIAVAMALARGITRRGDGRGPGTVGNFWIGRRARDGLRAAADLASLVALVFVSQGVVQNLRPVRGGHAPLEGARQSIALGPVASQEAIKQLGTNGGGFFNANAAHPFENPTPLTNFVSMLLIFAIPAGLTFTFGRMARDQRQGWALFAAMALLFFAGVGVAYWAEAAGNPVLAADRASRRASATWRARRSASGRELGALRDGDDRRLVRRGQRDARQLHAARRPGAALQHPARRGGLRRRRRRPLRDARDGDPVRVHRGADGRPHARVPRQEDRDARDEARDAVRARLPARDPVFAAWAAVAPYGLSSLNNAGPHGLSEILYAFTSAAGNNGSAFAGLNANTPFYNVALGIAMLVGRFWMIVPALAIAGTLAGKKTAPPGPGTLPTNGPLSRRCSWA